VSVEQRKVHHDYALRRVRLALSGMHWTVVPFELPERYLAELRRVDTNLRRLPDLAAYHSGAKVGPWLVDVKTGDHVAADVLLAHRALLDANFCEDVVYVFVGPIHSAVTAARIQDVELHGAPCPMPQTGHPGWEVASGDRWDFGRLFTSFVPVS
jgi:hypothetical protein